MSKFFTLFAATLTLISAASYAAPQDTVTDPKAVFSFVYCPGSPGHKPSDCGDHAYINVKIDGKSKAMMPVGNTTAISKQLQNVLGTYMFHKMKQSQPFSVTGYSEVRHNNGGWGPPTYTVFVITQSTMNKLPLPKGMMPKQ